MVRLPDATDHIRLAPVRALRAVFSGVGQLLLAADRLREEDARPDQEEGEPRRDTPAAWDGGLSPSVRLLSATGMPVPTPGRARNAPGGTSEPEGRKSGRAGGRQKRATQPSRSPADTADPSRFRSLDLTGNVRMLSDQDVADLAAEGVKPSTAGAAPIWSEAPEFAPAAPQAAALPISGYDDLSLPSLRARLRNLGPADLRDLLAHERSHANREDVVAMFERRIVKLEQAADNRG